MPETDDKRAINLDNLFSVAHVEVIQRISLEELKAVIQQLSDNVAHLSTGPRAQDLQTNINSLKEELSGLKKAHSQSLSQLEAQQV